MWLLQYLSCCSCGTPKMHSFQQPTSSFWNICILCVFPGFGSIHRSLNIFSVGELLQTFQEQQNISDPNMLSVIIGDFCIHSIVHWNLTDKELMRILPSFPQTQSYLVDRNGNRGSCCQMEISSKRSCCVHYSQLSVKHRKMGLFPLSSFQSSCASLVLLSNLLPTLEYVSIWLTVSYLSIKSIFLFCLQNFHC